jgi:uncharacterized protein (TIGR03663 family)
LVDNFGAHVDNRVRAKYRFHLMAPSGKESEEWRLGIEPGGAHDAPEADEEDGPLRNYSAERLERPLCVVTAEHLGWATVGVLALASRLVMLGARPLDSAEASHALSELALLHSGPPAGEHLSWVQLIEAAVFAALGAGDFNARVVFALSGLLLIATGFAMRRHIGRAGAMAFAALLVLSPSVAYFSRAADGVVPALAFAVLALVLFLELAEEPGRLLAAGLGAAVGLSLASGGFALMTALFMLVALATVGLFAAPATARVGLQVRVWWTRRKALLLVTTVTAAVVWLGCESAFFTRPPLPAIVAAFRSNLLNINPSGRRGFAAGLDFYLPILLLYEAPLVLLALVGALGVLTLRIRSRVATGALAWTALAVAFYLWTPARSPGLVVQMVVPMALLGALAIERLHHTAAWSIVRYPLVALALLTLCVQLQNNFIWYAPDASEAPWARTALLYWTEPATTIQTPAQCMLAAGQLPPHGASAFYAVESPALRWYLRALAPAVTSDSASAIIGVQPASLFQAQGLVTYEFELSDAWHPTEASLTPRSALHYLLNGHAWAPLDSRRVTIAVHPVVTTAPTVILAPVEPAPTATESPEAAAGSPEAAGESTPETAASPAASVSAAPSESTPSAWVTPTLGTDPDNQSATPAATLAATPTATSIPTPTVTPVPTPAATPSAIPSPSPDATPSAAGKSRRARRRMMAVPPVDTP